MLSLKGWTALTTIAAGDWRHLHGYFAVRKVKAEETTTCVRVETWRAVAKKSHIGIRDIDLVMVRCRAPLAPAQWPAFSYPRFPEDFSLLVWIERMNDAGFLSDDKRAMSVAQRHQDR